MTIPDEDQDRKLPEKLATELPGILAWCVGGCHEWIKSGLKAPEEVEKATSDYRDNEDILGTFLAEYCLKSPGVRVKATELYECYKAHMEEAGENPAKQRAFGEAMTERGFKRISNNGTWYEDIGLRQF